ncbi:MAG: radical SAM protein [Anaerolineales bacterium]|nr:MAG: radical SAM protein [Anaerolineales bacterium]
MIGVTKLLCGTVTPSDALRYGRRSDRSPSHLLQFSHDKKPVVVWNSTKACNLHCIHCYYSANARSAPDELTTAEAKAFIDDLAAFGAPVLLFSGGEPLLRDDLFELGAYAAERGIRAVISTNGTLIERKVAQQIKEAGFSYVGVSLDGIGETNDRFRGVRGAFDAALRGIRHCTEVNIRVGLRLTLNKHNYEDLADILDLLEEEHIKRACFYHLVYTGRGSRMRDDDLSLEESRMAVDLIFDRTEDFYRRGIELEVLTVDNHADGPYLLRRVQARQPERADEVLQLLRWNGGNSSGVGIGAVDHQGNVHADQFWQHYTFGNVRERPFSQIWTDTDDPLMAGLKHRKPLLKGRCAACQYLDICNGNFRVRAEAVYGDVWTPDPACYLTDEEIGL